MSSSKTKTNRLDPVTGEWTRIGPIASTELAVDFTGTDGGFDHEGAVDLWHFADIYPAQSGHTTGGLFYFGGEEMIDGDGHVPQQR